MCPQFPKQPPRAGGWAPQDRTVGRRSLPATPNHNPPSKAQTPALGPASPSKSGDAAATFPYPLTPPIPYPTPMPTHTRPTAPRSSRAGTSAPSASNGRRRPSVVRLRGWPPDGAGLAPKDDHGKVQSHFNGPMSRRSPNAAKVWVQGLPCLVSLCRFPAIFRPSPRPPFGPRPARYDLSPFSDRFNTPQQGPRPLIRSMPGRYDLSPFVDLSVAPQSQAAPRPSRHGAAGKSATHTIHLNSNPNPPPQPNAP